MTQEGAPELGEYGLSRYILNQFEEHLQGEEYHRLSPSEHRHVHAVGQAGGVLLTETIRASGLDRVLGEALLPWRKPNVVHDPGKVVLDLAVTLALGGDALADIAVLRAEPGLYGPVASDPTVSRVIAGLAADAPAALRAINTARATARSAEWRLAGGHGQKHTSTRRTDAQAIDLRGSMKD